MTGSRTATRAATGPESVPLTPYFFDILHQDGQDLLGLDGAARHEWLSKLDARGAADPAAGDR